MLSNTTISAHCLIVTACWVVGIALAVADALLSGVDLAALSVAAMFSAGILTMRRHNTQLAADWQRAYEIGREVSSIRRSR